MADVDIIWRVDFKKKLSSYTHSMMRESLMGASASAISMDIMGPMFLWLCERYLNFFFLNMLTILSVMPD